MSIMDDTKEKSISNKKKEDIYCLNIVGVDIVEIVRLSHKSCFRLDSKYPHTSRYLQQVANQSASKTNIPRLLYCWTTICKTIGCTSRTPEQKAKWAQ